MCDQQQQDQQDTPDVTDIQQAPNDAPAIAQPKPAIVTYMPTGGDIHPQAAKAYFAEMTHELPARGIPVVRLDPSPCSNLAYGFNRALCVALNLRIQGMCSHFAMLHADIQPDPWWLDTLYAEMEATGAHWVAAVSPIKDSHGTTSTAIVRGDPRQPSWNPWARLTMREVHELPETFTIHDLGDDPEAAQCFLGLNTGCMLLDLRPDWWDRIGDRGELEPHFDIRNRIVFAPGVGYEAQTETEDWMLSRILHGCGAKLVATRKVGIRHYGPLPFATVQPWGDWEHDQAGGLAVERAMQQEREIASKIHEHGYWLEDLPDGELFDEGLAEAIAELAIDTGSDAIDLGCGQGRYVKELLDAGINAVGCDGNPLVETLEERYGIEPPKPGQWRRFFRLDLAQPRLLSWGYWDLSICLEVGEHIPETFQCFLFDAIEDATRKTAILSWAIPGQPGHGHVNCRPNDWVERQMKDRGFIRKQSIERVLREAATLPYFKETLMVFERVRNR